MATNSESLVSKINSNIFFKEFTFSKNDFKDVANNQELEFADNVVWLDDLFFIYQVKEQEKTSSNHNNWFKSKVLNKAIKQIKSTLNYLYQYPEIIIENEKGHKLNIKKANAIGYIHKIVIFSTNEGFPEELRTKKFYESSEVGLIHLFHSEDYLWICKFLITPAEVNEYLFFREDLYEKHKQLCNLLPEQYILGHFLETLDVEKIYPEYINNVVKYNFETEDFHVGEIIDNFNKNIVDKTNPTDYYLIIQEIAKLNRSELIEFKKRVSLSIENCEVEPNELPYRIYLPRTDCAFVFIPLNSKKAEFWDNAINNFTLAHKYDVKAIKCIGFLVYRVEDGFYEFRWQLSDFEWEFEQELENLLNNDFPFRKTKMKKVVNRYKNI